MKDHYYNLINQVQGEDLYIAYNDNLTEIYDSIIIQGIGWVDARQGALFLVNEDGSLRAIHEENTSNAAKKIANYTYQEKKNLLLKKGEQIPATNLFVEDTFISCLISTPGQDKRLGVLLLEGIQSFENFSFQDFSLIETYCNNLGMLLQDAIFLQEKKELFSKFATSLFLLLDSTETHRENANLDYLIREVIRVSGLINTSQHLSTLLRELMESVKSVFRTESCSILLVDKKRNDLYFHIIAGEKEEEISKIRVPMGQGIAGTVAVTRQPMIINDAQNDDRVYKAADKTSGFVTRNILAAPLVTGDEVIGVMEGINTIDRNNFDDGDIDLFLSFSGAAAVAIQKARLLDDLQKANLELEKKVSELGSLFDLGQAVLESKGLDELLLRSLLIIVRELDANRAVVVILDENKKNLQLMSYINGVQKQSRVNYLNDSIIVHSILDNRIVLNNNLRIGQSDSSFDQEYLVGSYIILPLTDSNRKAFGAICISERNDSGVYTDNHLRLLQTISAQLIKGYENIRLNEDLIAKKTIEKEIEITSNIQKNLLPEGLPTGSNFDFGTKTVPAKEVSGDFYDFYKYADGQFSFLIADVSGKSLPAAIFMAMSSSIIRTLSRDHKMSPDKLLEVANELIYEDSQSGMFVTLFFIHYNPASFQIQFASAGHNDQIWIKNDGSYELIKGKGAPLGVIPKGRYIGGKLTPEPGDMIVLYTDGAIEQDNPQQQEYGLEQFVKEIIARKHLPAQQIVEEVYQDIIEFSEEREQFDDFTVLILKFTDDYQFYRKFPAKNTEIPAFRDFLFDTIKVKDVNQIVCDDILLCCDEAATNIVMHSYTDTDIKNPSFECYVKFTEDTMYVLLKDRGRSFDRSHVQKPSLEANLKGERKGGFGIYLIEKLMDKVTYTHQDGINSILIEKKIIQ